MLDEAKLLCERLERLVLEMQAVLREDGALTQINSLNQLHVTIEALEECGADVPEALRIQEQTLAEAVARQSNAYRALSLLQGRLPAINRMIAPQKENTWGKRKRVGEGTGSLFE